MLFNKDLIAGIKECFIEMSDVPRQKKLWLGGSKTKISSFTELISKLYDDFDFKGFIKYLNQSDFDTNLIKALCEIDTKLSKFLESGRGDKEDAKIIVDPVWQEVVENAKRILDSLKNSGL